MEGGVDSHFGNVPTRDKLKLKKQSLGNGSKTDELSSGNDDGIDGVDKRHLFRRLQYQHHFRTNNKRFGEHQREFRRTDIEIGDEGVWRRIYGTICARNETIYVHTNKQFYSEEGRRRRDLLSVGTP